MSVQDRLALVKKLKLCFNCLLGSHGQKACNSNFSCFRCKKRHHTSLCFGNQNDSCAQSKENNASSSGSVAPEKELSANLINKTSVKQRSQNSLNALAPPFQIENENTVMANIVSGSEKYSAPTVLLSTAIIYVRSAQGEFIPARSIIDNGSMCNLITNELADLLHTPKTRVNLAVNGVSGTPIKVKFKTTTTVQNKNKSFSRELDFLITPKITNITPSKYISLDKINFPFNVDLADCNFYKPSKISMLLGNEVFFQLLLSGKIFVPNSNLILQNSVFGYILGGSICSSEPNKINCGLITEVENLNNELRKFWEIEEVHERPIIRNSDEIQCDKHFSETYRRDEVGRFVVQMPLKKSPECLGESQHIALQKLNSQYKRLEKDPIQLKLYAEFMREYRDMGHMREVKEVEEPKINYYIPHLGVFRPHKNSTKMRVVFNASQQTTTGESLNSIQLNGGVIQDELFAIILRFRMHRFAFTADVMKMYRMINIDESQHDLQRILWKDSISDPVKTYKLCTVTYGTTSAPYLAMRCLKQLAIDGEKEYPLASKALKTNVYMDDILTGSSDLEATKKLQTELIELFGTCGMKLHKWCSNHPHLLKISGDSELYDFSELGETRALGLKWNPKTDMFEFNLLINDQESYTKRQVLSMIARIFDPLGLLGPIITIAKTFMQGLWALQSDWDDALPEGKLRQWQEFQKSLKLVNEIKIPRFVLGEDLRVVYLRGYADASEIAYGAVIYVVTESHSGKFTSNLLCSKSRVAPLKTITIPRLELSAAVLLVKLMNKVMSALKISSDLVYYFSDSTIVLAWLKKCPSELKTFVASRVAKIQQASNIKQWKHVKSAENPADFISRGCTPRELIYSNLWWHGPSLHHDNSEITEYSAPSGENEEDYIKELKISVAPTTFLVQNQDNCDFINKYSSFSKLKRITAWLLRFINNARNPLHKTVGYLTSEELSSALISLVKIVQRNSFGDELRSLQKGKALPKSSKLLNLSPFLDAKGLMRVGGRLKNSELNLNSKNPILLPNDHHFTNVLINYYHVFYFHIGPEGTLAFIRTKFWILKARNVIKKILARCITCLKVNAKASQQVMADLPPARVIPSRVFSKVGTDYAGPFTVKTFSGRVKKLNKIYVCIFICLVVKAVHLEIVHNLTTEAFLGALKRFIARRGRPSEVFSDNATNYVGANNELQKIIKNLHKNDSREKIQNYAAGENIRWHFNPPLAPHFGGLWEAGVKSLKHHLKRVIGNTILSHEEFLTLVTQVEAILNSRPLSPLSSDPNDIAVLTPAHFLIGTSLVALPEQNLIETPMNRLSRWQLVTKFTQALWKKWSREYLNRLQQRPKWVRGKVTFNEGDIVLVKNDNQQFLRWHLARIIKVHPGGDNITRVVTIKDRSGIHKRAVTSIAALPYVNNED